MIEMSMPGLSAFCSMRILALELLAKDEKGEIVWVDCRSAPYSECWDGEYLNEDRVAQEYTVEEYDFEKFEKRKYKHLKQVR